MPLPDDPPLNPYAAPQAELQPLDTRPQRSGKSSLRSWRIVFLVNLPLLTVIGLVTCDNSGRLGLLAMLALMLLMSSWLVVKKPWIGRRLIAGGVVVAICQVMPVLHAMIVGAGAFFVKAFGLFPTPPPPPPVGDDMDVPWNSYLLSDPYSFLAVMFLTLFVGLGLMLAAFAFSWLPIVAYHSELSEEDHG